MIISKTLAISSKDIVGVLIDDLDVKVFMHGAEFSFNTQCKSEEEAKALFDKIVNQMEY